MQDMNVIKEYTAQNVISFNESNCIKYVMGEKRILFGLINCNNKMMELSMLPQQIAM